MEIKKFFNLPYESKTFNCLKINYTRKLKSTFFYIHIKKKKETDSITNSVMHHVVQEINMIGKVEDNPRYFNRSNDPDRERSHSIYALIKITMQ